MQDVRKTKSQLIEELQELRRRVQELESSDARRGGTGSLKATPQEQRDRVEKAVEQFKMALRAGHAGCYDLDLSTNISLWTPELEEIYGMSPGTFSGSLTEWEACVVPDDLPDALASIRRAVETGEGVSSPFRIRRRDTGELRWIEARGRVLYDGDGHPGHLVGINADITDRVRSEDAARLLFGRLRLAQSAARAGMWDWDMQTETLTWTDELYALFGLDSTVPASFDTWLNIVHPEDRDAAMARIRESVERHCSLENEYRVVLGDGQSRWIGASGDTFYDERNTPQRMCGVCIDITARKKYEFELKRMRALYAALSQVNQAIVRTKTRDELFSEVCRVLVDFGRFSAAWIGLLDTETGQIRCVAQFARRAETEADVPFVARESCEDECSIGRCVRQGRCHVCNDLSKESGLVSCLDGVSGREWRSVATFPIRETGEVCGALTLYSEEPGFFGEPEISLLEEASVDVSFGLDIFRREVLRRRAEERTEATIELLRRCNQAGSVEDLIRDLANYFQEMSGCEAIGVRLRKGSDFPYYETRGFDEKFVRLENSLCAIDANGNALLGSDGNPLIECMCGNILCGRFDPSKPFFTGRGSFWSNCTTELLATTSEADRQARTRNRCNGEGYESVALIPIRSKDTTFGLFQFNDRRKGRFSAERIALFEDLADYVAIALSRQLAEEALRESEERFKTLFEYSNDAILVSGIDLNAIPSHFTDVNRVACSLLGYTREELLTMSASDIDAPEMDASRIDATETLARDGSAVFDMVHVGKDGRRILVEISSRLFQLGGRSHVLSILRDVTERKRAEHALALDAAIFNSITEGVVLTDSEGGTIRYVNARFEKMFGYDAGELLGKNIAVLNAPSGGTPEQVRDEILAELMRTGEWHGEIENVRKDGSPIWCYASVSTFGHPDFGQVFLGVQADISEHKRAELALLENETTLEAALASMADAVFISDVNGRFIHFNEAFATFHRFKSKAECARTLAEYPDILDVFMASGELAPLDMWAVSRALRGETVTYAEYGLRRKDTGETWLGSYSFGPIRDKKGAIIGSVVVGRDITDRKRAEDALREKNDELDLTLRSTGVGIWHWEVPTKRLSADRQTLLLLGIVPETFDGTQDEFFDVIHPEDRNSVRALLQEALERGTSYECEYRVVWSDQTERYLSARGKGVRDAANNPVRIDGVVWDASERRSLEQQLQQSQKMEAIGHLAGGVAHDFNNLLQVIVVNSELAQMGIPKESSQWEQIDEVYKAARRAAELTRQLLAFSRRQIIRPVDVDMNDLIQGVLKMLRRLIGEHIELCFVPGDRLANVLADKGQIEQVIMNLCVNARDAMPHGGRVTIETRHETFDSEYCRMHLWAKEGNYTMFSVADTGEGMDAATRGRIFEPFFTTKGVGKGTGLGLATVYGIVRQHFGLIRVYSEPGAGSVFKIYLPTVEKDVAEAAAEEKPMAVGGKETILVAEDEDTILRTLAFVLRAAGYTVITASDGNEAVRLFEENSDSIALAMLDVVMPGMSGREVMDEIKARGFKVPFLFSSGYSEDAIHTDFVIHEGLHLIQKPYSKEVLLSEVRKAIDAKKE